MSQDAPAACCTIHSLAHLRAALAAGAASGRPVVAVSAVGAAAYAGAGWFAALNRQGAQDFPQVTLTAVLDCADRAGDVLAALKAGMRHVIFTGHPDAAGQLRAIAAETGATILSNRPEACDLLNAEDPAYRARKWCEASR